MTTFWEKTKETIKKQASLFKGKVGEYSKYGKLSINKYNLTKQVEAIAADLGGRVYTLYSEKKIECLKDDEETLGYMLKLRGIENEIKKVEEKMKGLKEEKKKAKNEKKKGA